MRINRAETDRARQRRVRWKQIRNNRGGRRFAARINRHYSNYLCHNRAFLRNHITNRVSVVQHISIEQHRVLNWTPRPILMSKPIVRIVAVLLKIDSKTQKWTEKDEDHWQGQQRAYWELVSVLSSYNPYHSIFVASVCLPIVLNTKW